MGEPDKNKVFHLLLVEDNEADIALLSQLFKALTVPYQLHIARNGELAMEYLNHSGESGDTPRPHIIFLDLNMPKKDGREVLKEVKSDPTLKKIPVIVLTSSSADVDVCGSYESQANSFIQKPVDLRHYQDLIQLIQDYWLGAVELPRFKIPASGEKA